jgi:hypothetical protein
MVFCKIISYTCDLHLKLDILNPLKILYDFFFHQVNPMNMYFHKREHVFVVEKNLRSTV